MQQLRENLEALAQAIPIVWDRYTVDADEMYTCYGWIARKDGQRDFVLVSGQVKNGEFLIGFTTSSAKYSQAISNLLYGEAEDHNTCRPITELLNAMYR